MRSLVIGSLLLLASGPAWARCNVTVYLNPNPDIPIFSIHQSEGALFDAGGSRLSDDPPRISIDDCAGIEIHLKPNKTLGVTPQ